MANYRADLDEIFPNAFNYDQETPAIITSNDPIEPNNVPILVIYNPRTDEILSVQNYHLALTTPHLPQRQQVRLLNDFQMHLVVPKQRISLLLEVENLDLQVRILLHNPENGLISKTSLLVKYINF